MSVRNFGTLVNPHQMVSDVSVGHRQHVAQTSRVPAALGLQIHARCSRSCRRASNTESAPKRRGSVIDDRSADCVRTAVDHHCCAGCCHRSDRRTIASCHRNRMGRHRRAGRLARHGRTCLRSCGLAGGYSHTIQRGREVERVTDGVFTIRLQAPMIQPPQAAQRPMQRQPGGPSGGQVGGLPGEPDPRI